MDPELISKVEEFVNFCISHNCDVLLAVDDHTQTAATATAKNTSKASSHLASMLMNMAQRADDLPAESTKFLDIVMGALSMMVEHERH